MTDLDPILQAAFERGQLDARLHNAERRLDAINGSQARTAESLAKIEMTVQRLADQAEAREATVLTTAAALKAAEEARRSKTEAAWSPVQKLAVVVGILASLATVATVLLLLLYG